MSDPSVQQSFGRTTQAPNSPSQKRATQSRLKVHAELEELRKKALTKSWKAQDDTPVNPNIHHNSNSNNNATLLTSSVETWTEQLRHSKLTEKKQKLEAQKLLTSYRSSDSNASHGFVETVKMEKEEMRRRQKDAERLLQSYRAAPAAAAPTKPSTAVQTQHHSLHAPDVRASDLKIEKKRMEQELLSSLKSLAAAETFQNSTNNNDTEEPQNNPFLSIPTPAPTVTRQGDALGNTSIVDTKITHANNPFMSTSPSSQQEVHHTQNGTIHSSPPIANTPAPKMQRNNAIPSPSSSAKRAIESTVNKEAANSPFTTSSSESTPNEPIPSPSSNQVAAATAAASSSIILPKEEQCMDDKEEDGVMVPSNPFFDNDNQQLLQNRQEEKTQVGETKKEAAAAAASSLSGMSSDDGVLIPSNPFLAASSSSSLSVEMESSPSANQAKSTTEATATATVSAAPQVKKTQTPISYMTDMNDTSIEKSLLLSQTNQNSTTATGDSTTADGEDHSDKDGILITPPNTSSSPLKHVSHEDVTTTVTSSTDVAFADNSIITTEDIDSAHAAAAAAAAAAATDDNNGNTGGFVFVDSQNDTKDSTVSIKANGVDNTSRKIPQEKKEHNHGNIQQQQKMPSSQVLPPMKREAAPMEQTQQTSSTTEEEDHNLSSQAAPTTASLPVKKQTTQQSQQKQPAIIPFHVNVSFGLLTNQHNAPSLPSSCTNKKVVKCHDDILQQCMMAVSTLVQGTLQGEHGVVCRKDCGPFVTSVRKDELYNPPANRPNIVRSVVMADVPLFSQPSDDGNRVESTNLVKRVRKKVQESLRQAVENGLFLSAASE